MNDRSHRQQYLVFLAVVVYLGMSLQISGHVPFTEETKPRTLRFVEAFWVTASTLPTDTSGERPSFNEYSSGEYLFLVSNPLGTALAQQRRLLPTARSSLKETFPDEVYRPPTSPF